MLPFYEKILKKIREADSEKLVFFEPVVFDIFSGGFKTNPGGVN